MTQGVPRKTVIAAMELAYDYYSARTILDRHLRAAKLDVGLELFDAGALKALIASLGSEGPRTAPVIGLLDRQIAAAGGGNAVSTATRPAAEPAAAVAAAAVESAAEPAAAADEGGQDAEESSEDEDGKRRKDKGRDKDKNKNRR